MTVTVLSVLLLFLFFSSVCAQDSSVDCHYVCPHNDLNNHPLYLPSSESPPYDSPYSIFECLYVALELKSEFKCRYYKHNGDHALGHSDSSCHARADQRCSTPGATTTTAARPTSTNPTWVDRGIWVLWVKSHP